MSGVFVTDAGFVRPTLAEIKTLIETDFQAVLGAGADFAPSGVLGQMVGILARREDLIWSGVEEIYSSRDPSTATGVSLDNICAEVGIYRLPASATKVQDAILYGTPLTVVPAGSKARLKDAQDQTYSLDTDVSISTSLFAEVQLDPSKGLGSYTIVLDGVAYSVTVAGDAEKDATIDAMVAVVDATTRWEATRIDGPLLRIRPVVGQAPGALGAMSGYALKTVGSYGDFTGTLLGAITCPTEALNEIATSVSGWTGVYNRTPGQVGRTAELDEELRLRRANGFRGGLATDENILRAVYDDVEGLTMAGIVSNRSWDTDAQGLPRKSFEVTAVGGEDLDIAKAIWRSMPSGMESFGNVIDDRDGLPGIAIVDTQGYTQRVFFSRPVGLYIWVHAKVRLSNEEAAPAEWQASIKDAIMAQVGVEIKPGKDVVYQNLFKAIYQVAGIDFVELTIGKSNDALATGPDAWISPVKVGGVWTDEKIEVGVSEFADFDANARIAVELL